MQQVYSDSLMYPKNQQHVVVSYGPMEVSMENFLERFTHSHKVV